MTLLSMLTLTKTHRLDLAPKTFVYNTNACVLETDWDWDSPAAVDMRYWVGEVNALKLHS